MLTFRPGTHADLPALHRLIRAATQHLEEQGVHQWDELYPGMDDLQRDLQLQQLYVGLLEGRIAVMYVLNQEYDEAYDAARWHCADQPFRVIHRLCVHPEHQGKGLARQTLAHIHRQAAGEGAASIRLDVFTQNPAAMRLYESCGYHRAGQADWRMGRFWLMEKPL